ncbi:MAG: hypothetical protein HY898_20935 [Deltaproteobacteria bacterium]|nr:hypothetical protein [Deltaproteobacteria bacterium]
MLKQWGCLLALLSVCGLAACEPLTVESWFTYFGSAIVVGLVIGGGVFVVALAAVLRQNRAAGVRWGEVAAALGYRLVTYEEWMGQDVDRLRQLVSAPTPWPPNPSLDHAMLTVQNGVIVMAVPLLTARNYHFRAMLESPLGMGLAMQRLCTIKPFGAEDAERLRQGLGGLRARIPESLCGFSVYAEQPPRAIPLLRGLAQDILAAASQNPWVAAGSTSVRLVLRDHYVEYVVSLFRIHEQEHAAALPLYLAAAANLAQRVSAAARLLKERGTGC